jgi:hypothetical protein
MQRLAQAGQGAVAAVAAVARHAIWYVRYQVDGTVRTQRDRPPQNGRNGTG